MSEPIPESIPTAHLPKPRHSSQPAKKKARLTPTSSQATLLHTLFRKTPTIDPSAAASTTPLIPASNTRPNGLPPPPEIVANVQGSSAGAGSGEFHVYKASRRREYERLRLMEEEVKEEDGDREFATRKKEREEKEEKRKEKRRKGRERKKRGKSGKANGVDVGGEEEGDEASEGGEGAKVKNGGKKVKGGITLPPRGRGEEEGMEVDEGPVGGVEEVGVVIHDDD